jgi:predicted nucleotidyltransferase
MRITETERAIITSAIKRVIPDAEIYLFGSRAVVNAKGGDIDILVVSEEKVDLAAMLDIKIQLRDTLGDQKIDLVCEKRRALSPFAEMVIEEGISL